MIPKATTVPIYKSWSYLMRNEIAVEVGRKMFYTDSTGESLILHANPAMCPTKVKHAWLW